LGNVWPADTPGGLDRYLAELSAALRRAGAAATAVVIGPAEAAPVGVLAPGRTDQPLALRLWRFRWAVTGAATGADVVDSHFALNSFLPLVTGSLRGRPLVVHFQGPWAAESEVSRGHHNAAVILKRFVERSVYRRAEEMVTLSAAFKRIAVERYGVSPWRISVHPPGVDLGLFRPSDNPADRRRIREQLGIDPHSSMAVCVRRLDPRMGIEVLLDAWARLSADAVLVVAGDGALREDLERQTHELAIADRVRFLGRCGDEDLVSLYQAADFSVVPSTALEGFGLVVLESLACGTPAIVSDVGGLPEAVSGLDTSLIVPAGDAVALAARVAAATSGAAPLPDADRCRDYASAFTWDRVAEHALATYRRALAPHGNRPLRVVYLDHCARLSGGELALLRTVPHLEGVDAHVILAEDGPLVGRLLRDGVSVEVTPMAERARSLDRRRVGQFRSGRQVAVAVWLTAGHTVGLARRLRALRPDVVHTNSLKSALYGGVAARLAGVPVVWHVRDRIAPDYMPPRAVRLVRALARHLPAGVIANSHATLTTLGRLAPDTVCAVVPSPIDEGLLARAQAQPQMPLLVGIVGRLAEWKGQHVFLEAFARAFPGGTEEAVLVGSALFCDDDSDYEARLRRDVARLGLTGRVRFTGFVDDVAAEMEKMAIVVHASVVPEPFGQVVVEAMAMGRPVVASGAGGPAEVIDDGVNGLLHPPGDVEALAVSLKRLAADPQLRRRLGDAGRQRARSFTPTVVGPEITRVYQRVLGSRWPAGVPSSLPS